MNPAEVGARLVDLLGTGEASESFGQVTVDVPVDRWVDAVTLARDDEELSAGFFDWLSAVDQTDAEPPGYQVVCHLYSRSARHHVFLRTLAPAGDPAVPTLTGVFAGADWHERETAEMFGISFPGHPDPVPLLLPDGFAGHPLRKEFALAARAAKDWPGAREPGESHGSAPPRRRMRPPGVPDWEPAERGANWPAPPAADRPAAPEGAQPDRSGSGPLSSGPAGPQPDQPPERGGPDA